MEERIKREVRTTFQIVSVAAPRHFLPVNRLSCGLLRIETDAHRSLFLERSKVSLEALIAHQLTGISSELNR
jgi:hypothetical protein